MAENKTFGTFNATGPVKPYSMSEMLDGIKKAMITSGVHPGARGFPR
jgi:hypothetical protein